MKKKYIVVYIDPNNSNDLVKGDTDILGIGTLEECTSMCVGERNMIEDSEDNRIPHLKIFELELGKSVEFIFPKPPKPKMKIL